MLLEKLGSARRQNVRLSVRSAVGRSGGVGRLDILVSVRGALIMGLVMGAKGKSRVKERNGVLRRWRRRRGRGGT
jgi:hypothetical protein